MHYLITDLNIKLDGHKFGFVQNIIDFLALKAYPHHFTFLVNRAEDFTLKDPGQPHITLLYLSDKEQETFRTEKRLLKKSAIQWQLIQTCANRVKAGHVVLMELDLYQVAIGKCRTSFDISGIWFRPHLRTESDSTSVKDMMKHKLWMIQKDLLIRTALRNSRLKKVFVLNDEKVAGEMNKKYGQRFFHLPDPVFDYTPEQGLNIREHYNVERGRMIFLIFGYIDQRKNVLNIVEAMNALTGDEAARVCLLITGKFEPGFEEKIREKAVPGHQYQLIMNDSFVSDGEMECLFGQSDVSLRMNVGFYGSSGIIGTAAKYNKPSIVSDFGIVAELTEQYGLGVLVNPHNIQAIKRKIRHYLETPADRRINGQTYYLSHDRKAYVNTLLELE